MSVPLNLFEAYVDESLTGKPRKRKPFWNFSATLFAPTRVIEEVSSAIPYDRHERKWQKVGRGRRNHNGRVAIGTLKPCFDAILLGRMKLFVTFSRAASQKSMFVALPGVVAKAASLSYAFSVISSEDKAQSKLNFIMEGRPSDPNLNYAHIKKGYAGFPQKINRRKNPEMPFWELAYNNDPLSKMVRAVDMLAGSMGSYLNGDFNLSSGKKQNLKSERRQGVVELVLKQINEGMGTQFMVDGPDAFMDSFLCDKGYVPEGWRDTPNICLIEIAP